MKNHVFYFGQYGTQTAMLCFQLGKVYTYIPIPVASCFLGWNLRLTFYYQMLLAINVYNKNTTNMYYLKQKVVWILQNYIPDL